MRRAALSSPASSGPQALFCFLPGQRLLLPSPPVKPAPPEWPVQWGRPVSGGELQLGLKGEEGGELRDVLYGVGVPRAYAPTGGRVFVQNRHLPGLLGRSRLRCAPQFHNSTIPPGWTRWLASHRTSASSTQPSARLYPYYPTNYAINVTTVTTPSNPSPSRHLATPLLTLPSSSSTFSHPSLPHASRSCNPPLHEPTAAARRSPLTGPSSFCLTTIRTPLKPPCWGGHSKGRGAAAGMGACLTLPVMLAPIGMDKTLHARRAQSSTSTAHSSPIAPAQRRAARRQSQAPVL